MTKDLCSKIGSKISTWLTSSDWMGSKSEAEKSEYVTIIHYRIFYEICQLTDWLWLLATSINFSRKSSLNAHDTANYARWLLIPCLHNATVATTTCCNNLRQSALSRTKWLWQIHFFYITTKQNNIKYSAYSFTLTLLPYMSLQLITRTRHHGSCDHKW